MINLIRKLVRAVVPESIRNKHWFRVLRSKVLRHDDIYAGYYYTGIVEPHALKAADTMADSLIGNLSPASVIDVGCGSGALLAALAKRQVDVFGLEYSTDALNMCSQKGVPVERCDLRKSDYQSDRHYDLAVSLEVAEHLPHGSAEAYVRLLCSLAPVVVITAAPPGQGGNGHINEQPREYWIALFSAAGLVYDSETAVILSDIWKKAGCVEDWYWRNLMVFRCPR